ncbi:MAG: Lrp/AsnC family transcriptional regulator [Gemmatimonadetes bacterium]|nr:Lrp/AsnC family transcriptional regulator [Gemmatimonadota bacterium]
MIDRTDRDILAILQENSSVSRTEIARRVGLTPTAVIERIKKLEERGVVLGYVPRLDARALDRGLLAFLHVTEDESVADGSTGRRLAEIEGVEEVHRVAGEDGWLVKLRVGSPDQLANVLDGHVRPLASVRAIRTSIVLETVAEGNPLPLPPACESRTRAADPSPPAGPCLLWAVQGRSLAPSPPEPRSGR